MHLVHHAPDEVAGFHGYLVQTPEGPLRKMLLSAGKTPLTEPQFRLLLKLAKGCPEADFVKCFNEEGFGTLRLSTKEGALRETFWPMVKASAQSLGLLGAGQKAA
jgi:hypothetical protein